MLTSRNNGFCIAKRSNVKDKEITADEHNIETVGRAECLARFMFNVVQLFVGEGMAYVSRRGGFKSVCYVCCKQPMGQRSARISEYWLHQSQHNPVYVADH